MERSGQTVPRPALVVPLFGNCLGLRIGLDDRVEQGIELGYAVEITAGKFTAGECAGGHQPMQLGNRPFDPDRVACGCNGGNRTQGAETETAAPTTDGSDA